MGRNQSLIVPTLGNRDWVPANAMRSVDAAAYRGFIISGGFKQLLPEEVWRNFERGGYYSLQLSKNIRLVCLNTVLWYTLNNGGRSRSRGDPQLEWLREQLHDAQRHGQKVFISGHIGPGFFLRSLPGTPVSCAHLTGSVTPYGSSHPLHKFTSVSVNPSLRLYSYRRSNGMLLDYTVYYLDLQKANMAAASKVLQLVIGHQVPRWERLYSAKDDFGLQDLSTTSMLELAQRISRSPDLLSRYISYGSSLHDAAPCDGGCRQTMLCAIMASRRDLHAACLGRGDEGHSAHGLPVKDGAETLPTVRDVTVGLTVSASVVAGIVLLVIAKRARMMRAQHYGRFI
ncbi:hypothetical protein HPB51_025987 [Rhipicephalus microplus]|uniref:Sphingomyelin phosphodiesterase C-terminal domain-containing protein n=1 Tax=Rhipicephalus microplus TaxID=6941 RepID=A0A9J6EDT6_RHIMP|nr:hypothetical protein HPB51_025987 [Rhipicephalus microplus]